MSTTNPLHIAIIGGGLCGLSLAISLKARSIPFTLYESRSSFTEIGAGINLGPSAVRTLRLIDPNLGETVYALATRNPVPDQDVNFFIRYGAPSGSHSDAELFQTLKAPPTGSLTVHRQELLAAFAESMGVEHARFNKKFVGYSQDADGVTVEFADGSFERASAVIGCDGIHSKVRTAMFGEENPVSSARFGYEGAYRAVIPIEKVIEAIGEHDAKRTNLLLGPGGYIIMYPVNGGEMVNCGAWVGKKEEWNSSEWVKSSQRAVLEEDFKDWGDRAKKIMKLYPQDVSFWALHQHTNQPEHFQDGRVLLIGDGAHAMPPHQGSGAGQAVEDAYVLAEVLSELHQQDSSDVKVALRAVEEVRKPRFKKVHRLSHEAGSRFFGFYDRKLEGAELEEWTRETRERYELIWDVDMLGEAKKAKSVFRELISETEAPQPA